MHDDTLVLLAVIIFGFGYSTLMNYLRGAPHLLENCIREAIRIFKA